MSTSTWNNHPTSAQMSPHGSYHPNFDREDNNYNGAGKLDDEYDPDGNGFNHTRDHGSMRNYDDNHQQQSPNHSSHHHDSLSLGGYGNDVYNKHGTSDRGSVKSYGGGSPHGNLKDFASDDGNGMKPKHAGGSALYGNLKDCHADAKDHKFGGSGCGEGDGYGGNGPQIAHSHNYEHESTGGMGSMMDSWRPGMSWIDRRTFCMGDSCAVPLDWENHPILRQVPTQDHQAYRQNRLEEWLCIAHKRNPNEKFGAYMWRASALANSELKQRKKQCFGDEYTNIVDKFVMRLFYGMKLRLERSESIILGLDEETFVLEILREECEELYKNGQLYADQRSIQYTPLIAPEHLPMPSRPF